MINSKKAAEGILWTVVILAALLLFFFLYSNAWANLFRKSVSSINEKFDLAGDSDKDTVINLEDKCPCPQQGRIDSTENHGCPIGYKIGSNGKEESKECFTKKT